MDESPHAGGTGSGGEVGRASGVDLHPVRRGLRVDHAGGMDHVGQPGAVEQLVEASRRANVADDRLDAWQRGKFVGRRRPS